MGPLCQRHRNEDVMILADSKRLCEAARAARPERWSGSTRSWDPVSEVWLNPPKEQQERVSAHKNVA
jgi:putative transposase